MTKALGEGYVRSRDALLAIQRLCAALGIPFRVASYQGGAHTDMLQQFVDEHHAVCCNYDSWFGGDFLKRTV